jgi:ferric-dicitrate binding protein FerR (iron transport regulator)
MQAPEFDVEKALGRLQDKKAGAGREVVHFVPWKKILQVAAVAAFFVALSVVYLNTLDEQVSTRYAQKLAVTLPDASEIILNADSEISYDKRNWDKERLVSLDGEAYFKVAKGKKFTVATENGQVTVLGTQFNVENRNGYFEVTCFEGLVSVTFRGAERKLPAGTSFLAIGGIVRDIEAPDTDAPSWVDDESSFRSVPLSYVFDEFERQYNIKVETRNIDLKQLFTGTFSNTDMNLALQSISTPSQISFKLEENKVLFYAEDTP